MKKRALILILALVMLISSSMTLGGCSKAPEYYEIEARFRELVEASYDVNKILFGEGLPTYERVYDRTVSSYEIYDSYYYYEIDDEHEGIPVFLHVAPIHLQVPDHPHVFQAEAPVACRLSLNLELSEGVGGSQFLIKCEVEHCPDVPHVDCTSVS